MFGSARFAPAAAFAARSAAAAVIFERSRRCVDFGMIFHVFCCYCGCVFGPV
jgi:hypothetical protein